MKVGNELCLILKDESTKDAKAPRMLGPKNQLMWAFRSQLMTPLKESFPK